MQTISSTSISFVNFLSMIMETPNAILAQAKQIVVRNPQLLYGSEVIIRTNNDERTIQLRDTDVPFDKIVLAKTETGISVGIQRKQGDFPVALFQAIATAFATTRETINWGNYNHAKGSYAGNQTEEIKNYDFYYDGFVASFNGVMPIEPGKKRNALNGINWELVATPNGQIFLQVLDQKGQIFQTTLKTKMFEGQTPEQMVKSISFDQVQLTKNDTVTSFISIPNGNNRPHLIVAGKKGTYWNDSIMNDKASILGVDAKTGHVGVITNDSYYTAEITGDKITPLQLQNDQLGDDFKPFFKTSPRLLLNSGIALLTSVVEEDDHRVSFGRVLPRQSVQS